MISLNDIDAQLASLEDYSSESESSGSDSSSSSNQRPLKSVKVLDSASASALLKKKRSKGHSTICFQYLKGSCRFGKECLFRHLSPSKLESEDKIEIMRELRVKQFDADLSKVIRELNIPTCKTFAKTGVCKFNAKCQYWHIDEERIARWAGFDYWCGRCYKAFTSKTQLDEHEKGKLHRSKN